MIDLSRLRVILWISIRSLFVHRIKSLVVGILLFFGTFLVVFGGGMLDSIQASMQRSVTSSLSGDAQVYSAKAKDPLALFGGGGSSGTADYGEIDDFPKVREALMSVPNVHDVVPMGITNSIVFGTPEIDRVLEDLRDAVDRGDEQAVGLYAGHVRAIAKSLHADVEKSLAMASDPEKVRSDLAALDEASGDAFWQAFPDDPAEHLRFLDTRVAPLASDGRLLYFRLIGTDLDQFSHTFSSFKVVEGALPPPGQPGLMLAKRVYEKQIKNKVARDLDGIREARADGSTLADDAAIALTAQRLPKQLQNVLFQLAPDDAAVVTEKLREALGVEGDTRAVLQALLALDDANFDQHYALFYDVVAPRIRLYETPVGTEIVLRGITKGGYMKAVAVPITGTFEFEGLEGSDLAGVNNLIDLDTFRSLYGRMTAEQQAELSDIRAQAGVEAISREDAEAALFGDAPVATPQAPTETVAAPTTDAGLVLNAAVIFDDPKQAASTIAALEARSDADGLGLTVVDWQQASGIVGQLLMVLRVVLTVALSVIFLVALVIMNNTLVMAAVERTNEIGTMRAIGAPRSFVLAMLVIETLVLGLVAGGLGAGVAGGLVAWLGDVGIPATANILVFLFGGRRLYPSVSPETIVFGVGIILVMSVLSTLYPAWVASRVAPVVAMQGKE